MFEVEIRTGGSAFCNPQTGEPDDYFAGVEVCRILKKIQNTIELSDGTITSGTIMDINGNRVGSWELE